MKALKHIEKLIRTTSYDFEVVLFLFFLCYNNNSVIIAETIIIALGENPMDDTRYGKNAVIKIVAENNTDGAMEKGGEL